MCIYVLLITAMALIGLVLLLVLNENEKRIKSAKTEVLICERQLPSDLEKTPVLKQFPSAESALLFIQHYCVGTKCYILQ